MKVNVDTKEAIRRWDGFADHYAEQHAEQGDLHKEIFLNPVIFSMMGSIENKKVLDAGCGEGYLSRLLANKGAVVTAVDYSPRMLEIAKERTPAHLAIDYQHGSCEDLHFLADQTFDVIVSNMVIHDLAEYKKAFQEIHRLLVNGGQFIFSILHPCFVTPKSGWVKSETGEKLYWKVDDYFYEGTYEQPMGHNEKMLFYHRTLTSYINAMVQTGFVLESIEEPVPSEDMLKKHPSFQEDFRCADFIVFHLKKG